MRNVEKGARRHRLARSFLCATLLAAAGLSAVGPASAFELFGIRLWGEPEEEETDISDPLHYTVDLTVAGGDEELEERLEEASSMVADQERPVSGSLGLLAKARGERELLIAALYEEARYDGVVEILIAGQALDELPPDAEFGAGPVPVSIRIEPGQVFTLGDISLAGDSAGLVPARFGLEPGGNAGSEAILAAEAAIVRALKSEGHPLARISDRAVIADHATRTLDITLTLSAGPVAPYGETTVQGTKSVDPSFTAYMAGLKEGERYSPEDLTRAQERLTNLEVFNSVAVREADALDAQGRIPIEVEVSERKHRYFGAGATYSSTDGAGIEGYWGHRNLFGRAEKLRIEGGISRIGDSEGVDDLDFRGGILFEKPGVIGPASKFFSRLESEFEHPDAYDRFSVRGGAGVSYELGRTQSVSAELLVEWSKIDDFFEENQRHLLVSTPLQYVLDNRDNRLNPTKGFRLLAYGEPTYDIETGAAFIKVRGEASAYRALDSAARFVAAGRVAAGSILGANLADVPADRRFYAGGGGSVRGYAYQGVGPRCLNRTDPTDELIPCGGLSFAEASLELRYSVTETIGIVPFVDIGTVSAEETPDFGDIKTGAGLGLRYLTPFGPLRIDAAIPLDREPGDPSFGIYAGVGQAF